MKWPGILMLLPKSRTHSEPLDNTPYSTWYIRKKHAEAGEISKAHILASRILLCIKQGPYLNQTPPRVILITPKSPIFANL